MHALRAPGGRDERRGGLTSVAWRVTQASPRSCSLLALMTRRVVDATASDSEWAVREAWLMGRDG